MLGTSGQWGLQWSQRTFRWQPTHRTVRAVPSHRTFRVHRLRDLDRNQRLFALGLGVALALAPLVALIHYAPHWYPAGDPALMGLRSLDVGTSRTPLIGQPSLSFTYVDGQTVSHLGGVHFYLMAPFVHLLGVRLGMIVVSVLITGACLLVAGWVGFRQLGPAGGAITAVVLGAVELHHRGFGAGEPGQLQHRRLPVSALGLPHVGARVR